MKSKNKLKQKKQPNNFKYFDTSKTYMCPMIRKDTTYPNEIEDIVEVKLEMDRYGYTVKSISNNYHDKYFFDLYLDWLFYTKYITEKS